METVTASRIAAGRGGGDGTSRRRRCEIFKLEEEVRCSQEKKTTVQEKKSVRYEHKSMDSEFCILETGFDGHKNVPMPSWSFDSVTDCASAETRETNGDTPPDVLRCVSPRTVVFAIVAAVLLPWCRRGTQEVATLATNATAPDNGVGVAVASSLVGFFVGVPGVPGLWDNVAVGTISGVVALIDGESHKPGRRIVNGFKASLGRLDRARKSLAKRLHLLRFEEKV